MVLNILLSAHITAMTCAHAICINLASHDVLHWHDNMYASDVCREVSTQSIQPTAQMVLIAATVQVRHQVYHLHLLPVANFSLAIYRLQICDIIRQAYTCAVSVASCGTKKH